MNHVIEAASTGRAKCRACEQPIAKGVLRFPQRRPNPFGEGEMTLWFHPMCAAFKRPQPLADLLKSDPSPEGAAELLSVAERSLAHRRLPRVSGAQTAPTGRARCRHCKELIDKGTWRIPLVYFEEGRFAPMGFIHAGCAEEYLGTSDLEDRVRHFSPELGDTDVAAFTGALASG